MGWLVDMVSSGLDFGVVNEGRQGIISVVEELKDKRDDMDACLFDSPEVPGGE